MDFKKMFENNKAVSPVIGVILMVAITVILAAAIGSSVFGQGTTESAPQANFDIKAVGLAANTSGNDATVRIEHLGGSLVHFDDNKITKVTATVEDESSVEIDATGLGDFDVGSVQTLKLISADDGTNVDVADGETVNIKIIDVQTNQLICDKEVRF